MGRGNNGCGGFVCLFSLCFNSCVWFFVWLWVHLFIVGFPLWSKGPDSFLGIYISPCQNTIFFLKKNKKLSFICSFQKKINHNVFMSRLWNLLLTRITCPDAGATVAYIIVPLFKFEILKCELWLERLLSIRSTLQPILLFQRTRVRFPAPMLGHSQLPLTPDSGYLTPFLDSGHCTHMCKHMHIHIV